MPNGSGHFQNQLGSRLAGIAPRGPLYLHGNTRWCPAWFGDPTQLCGQVTECDLSGPIRISGNTCHCT